MRGDTDRYSDASIGHGIAPSAGPQAIARGSGSAGRLRPGLIRRLWPWGEEARAATDDEPADPYLDQAWVLAFVSACWFAQLLGRTALALTAFFFELSGLVLQVAWTVAIMLPIHFAVLGLVLTCRDGPAPGTPRPEDEAGAPDSALKKAVRWWLDYYRWAGLLLTTGIASYFLAGAAMPLVPIRYQVLIAALGVAEPALHLVVQILALGAALWLTARTLGRA